jgi:hypothetical protein
MGRPMEIYEYLVDMPSELLHVYEVGNFSVLTKTSITPERFEELLDGYKKMIDEEEVGVDPESFMDYIDEKAPGERLETRLEEGYSLELE